jgi:hypothetical protein
VPWLPIEVSSSPAVLFRSAVVVDVLMMPAGLPTPKSRALAPRLISTRSML